jgi:hypothetical protein
MDELLSQRLRGMFGFFCVEDYSPWDGEFGVDPAGTVSTLPFELTFEGGGSIHMSDDVFFTFLGLAGTTDPDAVVGNVFGQTTAERLAARRCVPQIVCHACAIVESWTFAWVGSSMRTNVT